MYGNKVERKQLFERITNEDYRKDYKNYTQPYTKKMDKSKQTYNRKQKFVTKTVIKKASRKKSETRLKQSGGNRKCIRVYQKDYFNYGTHN
jgi:hypothetical protein